VKISESQFHAVEETYFQSFVQNQINKYNFQIYRSRLKYHRTEHIQQISLNQTIQISSQT